MKKSIYFFLTLIGLLITIIILIRGYIESSYNPNKVEFTIKLEHEVYIIGQDVWLTAKLINNSGMDYYMKEDFALGNVKFDITDPNGQKIRRAMIDSRILLEEDSVILPSGKKIEKVFSLSTYFQSGPHELGMYKIQATYQGIKSNLLTLETKEPVGLDKEVYDQMYNVIDGAQGRKDYFEQMTKGLEELLSKYPTTLYAPQLYSNLFLGFGYSNEAQVNFTRLDSNINNYLKNNDSAFATEYIVHPYTFCLSKFVKLSNEEIANKLQELSNIYKGTKAETIINEYISEDLNIKK